MILFGTSSAAEDDISDVEDVEIDDFGNAKAAAGFSIFVGIVAFIYEILFIVCRFLNFAFMIAARTIILIVVCYKTSQYYYYTVIIIIIILLLLLLSLLLLLLLLGY